MADTGQDHVFAGYLLGERVHVGEGSESYVCVRPGGQQLLLLKRVAPPGDVAGFLMATEIERRFDHPCLCGIHGSGRVGETGFVVRDFARGKDLRGLVRRLVLQQQTIDEPTALHVTLRLCSALEYVHRQITSKDLVRCALSTQSVVLGYDGAVRWVAPLAAGNGPDVVADIRALGLCLHEMLTGSLAAWDGQAASAPAGSEAARLLQPALEACSWARAREQLQTRIGGQAATRDHVAALVRRVFPRGRQTEELWRSTMRHAAGTAGPAGSSARPAAAVSPDAGAAGRSLSLPGLGGASLDATDQPTAVVWRRRWRPPSAAAVVFALLVGLCAAFIAHRAVVLLTPPRATVSVRSEMAAEVRVDGATTRRWAPCDLELPAGRHSLSFRFPHGEKPVTRVLDLVSREAVEVRLLRPPAR